MALDLKDLIEFTNSLSSMTKGTAEYTSALNELKQKYAQLLREQQSCELSLKELSSSANRSTESFAQLALKKQEYARVIGIVSEKLNALGVNVMGLEFGHMNEGMGRFIDKLGLGNSGIKEFTGNLISRLGTAVKDNASLFLLWGSSFARNIVSPTKEWKPISDNPAFKEFNVFMKEILTTQAVARRAFTALGDSIGEANRKTTAYLMNLRTTQAALGMTKQEQQAFNKEVTAVPGVLEQASDSLLKSTNLQGQMVQTSGILQTALQRFKMTGAEAAGTVQKAFLGAGLSAEQFADFLGQANAALRGTDVDARIALQQMLQANNVMGIFGDQASRTTSTWHEFATTLRGSGVAIEQIGTIVDSVTRGLAGMSVQNRAFIGMMSGMFQGATALGGALRMELAMRGPGGLEQNLEALTSTLARFGGGQVITLQEAATNPQLEMQFALQRQMLGKLTGITTTEQQNRVLEVLQGVQRGGISRAQGGVELKNVMEKGRNIQEQLVTSLERQEQILQTNLVRMSNTLGDIDTKLGNFNTTFGIGREAGMGLGQKPISESPIAIMGRAVSAQHAAMFREELPRSFRLFGRQIRQNLIPGPGTDIAPRGLRGERVAEGQADIRLGTARDMFAVLRNAVSAFKAGLTGEEPRLRTRGAVPAGLPNVPEAAAVPMRSARMGRAIEEINRTTITERAVPPSIAEVLAGPTPRGAGLPATPTMMVSRTESAITVKVESNNVKLQKIIEDAIEKAIREEVPKYISGELP